MNVLKNKYFRSIVPLVLAAAEGLLGNAIFSVTDKLHIAILIIILAVIFILEFILVVFYIKCDNDNSRSMDELESELEKTKNELSQKIRLEEGYSNLIKKFEHCFDENAAKIYKLVENAKQSKAIDLNIWNYRYITDFVCANIFELISLLAESGDNFSVNYIAHHSVKNNKRTNTEYLMMSYTGKEKVKPHMFQESISKKEAGKYYFSKLFEKNSPDITYLMTSKEVDNNFYYRANSTHRGKYSQYFGIPICCSGHKMIGLVQIVAHGDSLISSDKDRITQILNEYVMTYATFILFAEKIEKGISFIP